MRKLAAIALALAFAVGALFVIWGDALFKKATWTDMTQRVRLDAARGWIAAPADRPAPVVFSDPDSFYWLSYARASIADGRLRIRRTDLDNAPFGREVHWSSSVVWLIRLAAGVRAWSHPAETDDTRIESAALWSMPALFGIVAVLMGLALARRIGATGAAITVFAWVALPVARRDFRFGRIDHPGLLTAAILAMWLGVLDGLEALRREESRRAIRLRFALSGFAGGMALWVQASFGILALCAIGAGIGLSILFGTTPRDPDRAAAWADALRVWGAAGAATSLVFYLLEYAPRHMAMRLEVNHPMAALAWFCGASLLALLVRQRADRSPWPVGRTLLLAAGALALPLLQLFGPESWYSLRDPILLRIHEGIREFLPLSSLAEAAGSWSLAGIFGAFPLFVPAAVLLLRRDRCWTAHAPALLAALGAGAVTFALALRFNRFAGLHAAALVALTFALVAALQAQRRIRAKNCALALLAAVALAQVAIEFRHMRALTQRPGVNPAVLRPSALRDAALDLRTRLPDAGGAVVICGYDSPYFQFFGELRSAGGLYWENAEGLRDTVAFFGGQDDERAKRIARRRGAHYVIADTREGPVRQWRYCLTGDPSASDSLAQRLAEGRDAPPWLREIPPPAVPVAARAGFRIYRVDLSATSP